MNDEIPAAILEAVRRAVTNHPDDLGAMIECAVRDAVATADYKSFRDALAARAVRGLVYDERHRANGLIRRAAGAYGGPAKVNRADSEGVRSVYDYSIAGRSLGQLYGRDLAAISESENGLADGHLFNARLCERLRKLVKDDEQVRAAVKEAKLRTLFRELDERNARGKAA